MSNQLTSKSLTTNLPLISIVTPSYNQSKFVSEAVMSVQLQNYKDYEHLIIDGMSTDGTADIMHGLATNQANLSWISEADSGQSEALNKGFRLARGEIIGWLNSDDRYRTDCFKHIVKAFVDNPEIDIVYGDYLIIDEQGKALRIRREIDFNEFVLLYHRVLYIPTTATFFRRRIFDEGNWLNESLQYAMDFDFFVRLAACGYRFKHISEVLADFRLQPNSKSCSFPDKQRHEHQQIIFATAPIFCRLKSARIKKLWLLPLRWIACARRYSEKLLRGYYWERLCAK
jgi:glycosyltransferase involved in cell wall biosynthesis